FLSLLDFHLNNLLGLGIALILWLTAVYIAPDKLGGGDIKLCAAVSIVIGFTATTYGIIIGFGIVSLVWLAMLFCKIKQEAENCSLPLAPFLGLGFLTTYFIEIGGRLI
ncbi:MAG: prepilin peptidase, partial [Candidatus Riflebacteria bacterium]|nr:prepilin peptidase [Candidatus Riflebacteria bacterium]